MMLKSLAYLILFYETTEMNFIFYREISKHLLNEFQTSLSYETWEDVFSNNDKNTNTSK